MSTAEKIQQYTIDEYYEEVKNYDVITELRNSEIVCFSSPSIMHQRISRKLLVFIDNFITLNKGKCEVFDSPTDVKLNDCNIVVPDIFVACDPDKFDRQKYNGAPDWIIEIVSTNWADDYCRKHTLYFENGVREYWIVDPQKETVTVYFFEEKFVEHYTFAHSVPVNIYGGELKVNIAELLK